jgi:hypothetical protein
VNQLKQKETNLYSQISSLNSQLTVAIQQANQANSLTNELAKEKG